MPLWRKSFIQDITDLAPDVFCLQETKAAEDDVFDAAKSFRAIMSMPTAQKPAKDTQERPFSAKKSLLKWPMIWVLRAWYGRQVLTAEYADYFIVTAYCPNSGEELVRFDYRQKWDKEFKYLQWLDKRKPVILCGDLNVAHQPIDLTHSKANYNVSAGYTQQEIDGFKAILEQWLRRYLSSITSKEVKYTYWNNWQQSREKNIGWRIDYFMVKWALHEAC